MIIVSYDSFGPSWLEMEKLLPGRTSSSIRNRWQRILHGTIAKKTARGKQNRCGRCGEVFRGHLCAKADEEDAEKNAREGHEVMDRIIATKFAGKLSAAALLVGGDDDGKGEGHEDEERMSDAGTVPVPSSPSRDSPSNGTLASTSTMEEAEKGAARKRGPKASKPANKKTEKAARPRRRRSKAVPAVADSSPCCAVVVQAISSCEAPSLPAAEGKAWTAPVVRRTSSAIGRAFREPQVSNNLAEDLGLGVAFEPVTEAMPVVERSSSTSSSWAPEPPLLGRRARSFIRDLGGDQGPGDF